MFNFLTRIPRISRISTPSDFFPVRHSENRCLQRKRSVRSVRFVWDLEAGAALHTEGAEDGSEDGDDEVDYFLNCFLFHFY